jgi:hypothetical protein
MDKLSICNSALMRCGAEPILIGELTTPTSKRGLAVVNQYETTLKEMLNDSSWNFATVRVELTEELTVPLFGATRLYTLPNDCIRVLELEDKVPYRVETGLIHCDQESVLLKACRRHLIPNGTIISFTTSDHCRGREIP